MIIETKIDWESCQRCVISADRDDLPAHIRAIKVPTLDSAALRQAFELLGGEVTSVQIEAADVPKDLLGFPHRYILEHGRFNMELQPVEFRNGFLRTGYADIKMMIDREFAHRAAALTEPDHTIMEHWHDCVVRMPLAASNVFPKGYQGFWIRGDGRFDQREHPGFHRHGAFEDFLGDKKPVPGYFLNFTPSHDGTVFPDDKGNLWYAPGGAYTLFTSDGHDHVDGCVHEVPDQFQSPITDERRATAVLQIFPQPEM